MHPLTTIAHWSHHWHDSTLMLWHHVHDHLHSRHFWVGVVMTLFVVGIMTLLFMLARNAPIMYPHGLPYTPYM